MRGFERRAGWLALAVAVVEAPDVVYEVLVTEPVEDLLAATDLPGSNYTAILYIRDGCGEGTMELACDRQNGIGNYAMIRTGPLPAGTYYVFVDGRSPGHQGTYEASIQLLMGEGQGCDPTPGLLRCAPGLACTPAGDEHTCQLQSRLDTGPLPPGAYYIFVDGFSYRSGTYELRVTITP